MKNKFNFFSIRWKLSIAFIAIGMGLVITYVVIAKAVFESDKISYVFDSQRNRVVSLGRELDFKINKNLYAAKNIIGSASPEGQVSGFGRQIFDNEKDLLAVELLDISKNQEVLKLEKREGILANVQAAWAGTKKTGEDLFPQKDGNFLFTFKPYMNSDTIVAGVLLSPQGLLAEQEGQFPVLVLYKNQIVLSQGLGSYDQSMLSDMAAHFWSSGQDMTTIWSYGKKQLLVSSSTLSFSGIKILTFTFKNDALGALRTLFARSIVFLFFSAFGLIALSVVLSANMTNGLKNLTESASRIGQGDFSQIKPVTTKDEMGILSSAFAKMSSEIQRLLHETHEKARMEAELKTAKVVQESLLPQKTNFLLDQIEINGVLVTSTECGGDWWYYFRRGDEIYLAIADATGHGTPAALITAAARSIFSRLESEYLSLNEMMKAWDLAVFSCSGGKVFMTAILMKIHSKNGKINYISAGHEAPVVLRFEGDGFVSESLDLDVNPVLGERKEFAVEQEMTLEEGASLVLYTDGLSSVPKEDGSPMSERRYFRKLAGKAEFARSAKDITDQAMALFTDHVQGRLIPDDVTLVTVRRKGTDKEAILVDDSGSLSYQGVNEKS